MTKKQKAKEVLIEAWTYLYEHPEIRYKDDLPPEIYYKLREYKNSCPFCEYYVEFDCKGCSLNDAGKKCHYDEYNPFSLWLLGTKEQAHAAAGEILEYAKGWEV